MLFGCLIIAADQNSKTTHGFFLPGKKTWQSVLSWSIAYFRLNSFPLNIFWGWHWRKWWAGMRSWQLIATCLASTASSWYLTLPKPDFYLELISHPFKHCQGASRQLQVLHSFYLKFNPAFLSSIDVPMITLTFFVLISNPTKLFFFWLIATCLTFWFWLNDRTCK